MCILLVIGLPVDVLAPTVALYTIQDQAKEVLHLCGRALSKNLICSLSGHPQLIFYSAFQIGQIE